MSLLTGIVEVVIPCIIGVRHLKRASSHFWQRPNPGRWGSRSSYLGIKDKNSRWTLERRLVVDGI